jgi:hypothetical protein
LGKPYLRKSDDRLHLVAQTEIFLLLLAGNTYYYSPVPPDSAFDGIMSALLIACVLVFGAFFLFQGYLGVRKVRKDRKVRHKDLAEHDAHEDENSQVSATNWGRSPSQIADNSIKDEDGEVIQYYKKRWFSKIIPDKAWKKWPLYKYARYKDRFTKPIDTGRILLKGIQSIDRRQLNTKSIFSEKLSSGQRIRSESDSVLARGLNRDKEKVNFNDPNKPNAMGVIPEMGDDGVSENSGDEKSLNEKDLAGAAWAEAGPPVS